MLSYVLIGALAAFGLMCAVWILCGLVRPKNQKGILLYAGADAQEAAQRYLWLREMGLVSGPLLVLEPEGETAAWLQNHNIEIVSRAQLLSRLEMGAEEN